MATPGKPRQSGIPGPGRMSSIPTPGRSRSSSTAYQQGSATTDAEDVSRAFAEAIKANDPAQHRVYTANSSTTSLSPQSATTQTQSGRRSVTGRPSSSASTSSATSSVHPRTVERAKTPTSIRHVSRPPSRHSDVFSKSINRVFDVGDNVRIESLGYEGMLRFMGEIEGKLGLWAGVELSGGFAGKGKNNGSVNGKQYFSCPDNCGVFVATTKLSPPTVGPGAISRPSSVASSRGGRITPALSGRITPSFTSSTSRQSASFSNGRVTPSISGRITPSFSSGRVTPGMTPSANSRMRTLSKSTTTKPSPTTLTDKITAGSRASKYMSMTAKQLNSRDAGNQSPSRSGPDIANSLLSSPSQGRSIPSPTRPPGSPFSTPKPSLAARIPSISAVSTIKNRPSTTTPRARVPSAVAMPPPASPISSISRSVSSTEYPRKLDLQDSSPSLSDLEIHGKVLQEKIAFLTSSHSSQSSPSRPGSVNSIRSTTIDDSVLTEQLQSRLQALEYENERLRLTTVPNDITSLSDQLQLLQSERDSARQRLSEFEEKLSSRTLDLDHRDSRISSLEQELQQTRTESEIRVEADRVQLETTIRQYNETLSTIQRLQVEKDIKENLFVECESKLQESNSELVRIQSDIAKARSEFEDEKRELSAQIDELRVAGQETIALYEERLSMADSQRYEFETKIASLESSMSTRVQGLSSSNSAVVTPSAAQIDNETLRDQVIHLQKKISTMEDVIEDARATSEKEEAAFRERMKRLKEKEEGMRKELSDGRKEVERMSKSEHAARNRVEEIEEALRESTEALENARAEVEVLRTELANLDGLVGDDGTGDLSTRMAEFTQRASADRARFNEELKHMQNLLAESRTNERNALERLTVAGSPNAELHSLHDAITELQVQNDQLRQQKTEVEAKLVLTIQELDELKRKTNLDAPTTNSAHDATRAIPASPSLSKYDLSAAREEIKGLKHIVQELQKENLAGNQRIKLLESENQLLSSEAEQLRQEVHILEENLDNNMTRDDDTRDENTTGVSGTGSGSRILSEQQSRLEMELEQLRKRLADVEMKHARTTHDLNKEISELEALVESKIYREDELEQEVERLKEKLTRQKKSRETTDSQHRLSTASSSTVGSELAGSGKEDLCEICERPGHDIFNCDLLKDEVGGRGSMGGRGGELFCDDCENHGHVAANCPHSLDVF
ncbi:hypothetical protein BDQ12DRAFT_673277 [Crucibulum laeve]|uniref:CAP-Gly domain-containing protein n=1 Tax=Crucibulum laeve TaxID=68775 RepID=A0A5C3MI61_9AGAR|nr:hypothetical protein BDQ12DRAFT_673277 [Crucibulum laeve]